MPLLNAVTTPYAEAFLQVCEESSDTDLIISQARDVLELWTSSAELREAMASPILEVESKKAGIKALFKDNISPTLLNLLNLLADRQRIGMLGAVIERLLELYREKRNIALATITSAAPLKDQQQKLLEHKVRQVSGTDNVEIKLEIDPSIIGGFVISVGSQVIDASLTGQVRRLGLELARVT